MAAMHAAVSPLRRRDNLTDSSPLPLTGLLGPLSHPDHPSLTSLMFQTRNCRAVYTQPHCSHARCLSQVQVHLAELTCALCLKLASPLT